MFAPHPLVPHAPEGWAQLHACLTQVLQGTAQELGVLAASDSIGDLPKDGWFEQFTAVIENSILGLPPAAPLRRKGPSHNGDQVFF